MIVLGIEGSAREGSVALVDFSNATNEPTVIGVQRIAAAQGAGRLIAPAIERLLADAHLDVARIECFVTGLGPGGYTGSRLAVATARALGFAVGRPVLGVESTAAIAARPEVQVDEDGGVFVVLDAKNGDVYAARYRRSGSAVEPLVPPFVAPASHAVEFLGADDFVAGDGFSRIAAIVPGIRGDASLEARADEIARLGLLRFRRGEVDSPAALLPLYLRASEAERLWAARRTSRPV